METGIPAQGSGCAKTLVSVAIMVSYAKVRAHSKLEVSTESYLGNFCSSAIEQEPLNGDEFTASALQEARNDTFLYFTKSTSHFVEIISTAALFSFGIKLQVNFRPGERHYLVW